MNTSRPGLIAWSVLIITAAMLGNGSYAGFALPLGAAIYGGLQIRKGHRGWITYTVVAGVLSLAMLLLLLVLSPAGPAEMIPMEGTEWTPSGQG